MTRRRVVVAVLIVGVLAVLGPSAWLRAGSADHVHAERDAPAADLLIVFGASVHPDGKRPLPFLAGRLDTTIALLKSGRARAVLVSGYSRDGSATETTVMTRYLLDHGVPQRRIVVDRYGVDTYDTCRRAREVYGVDRALLVTQRFHLYRAVTLCRHLGVDAEGVAARCTGCERSEDVFNQVREVGAGVKAGLDVTRDRPPAIRSSADHQAIRDALSP